MSARFTYTPHSAAQRSAAISCHLTDAASTQPPHLQCIANRCDAPNAKHIEAHAKAGESGVYLQRVSQVSALNAMPTTPTFSAWLIAAAPSVPSSAELRSSLASVLFTCDE